jgi:DNA-binding CsgD family transcriptional regulator
MGLNPRSVDTLRDQLFTKLDVRSRVGLAMVAIKQGVVTF